MIFGELLKNILEGVFSSKSANRPPVTCLKSGLLIGIL